MYGDFFMVLKSRWMVGKEEVSARNGLVTASSPEAACAGLKMLKMGGNALDATVAMGFCNTVVEPYLAGLAGMGFMLIHSAEEDRNIALDFNARAHRLASPDMFKVVGEAAAGGTRIFDVENEENIEGAKAFTVPAT